MDHPPPFSSIANKPKGYRRRRRPARKICGTNDGKDSSVPRHRHTSSTRQASPTNESIVIPFPVPPILTTRWLIKMAPMVLAQHLVYARGMWPMSVPQLLLLQQQQQDKSNQDFGSESKKIENNKRQRVNRASRINPSLRRKQQRATDQINRLSDEWARYVDGIHTVTDQKEEQCDKLPKFLLILLGSSYTRGRELYLLDFQSLIDGDGTDAANPSFTEEQERKYKVMLARKLVSALMNHRSDHGTSISNSLPAPTSPSFRLWFTAGFENGKSRDDFSKGPLERDDGNSDNTIPAQDGAASTISWIPRTKFPSSKPQSRPSSQTQSLITIRFVRSSTQIRGKQQNSNQPEREYTPMDTASTVLHPTSEQLSWMSLVTHVKGFRL